MEKRFLLVWEMLSESKRRFHRWVCETFHHTAGPFRDEKGRYLRCLDCGRRIPWEQSFPLDHLRGGKAA